MIDSFSHTPILNLATLRYGTVFKYLLVTSLRSMFTVNDARCTNQLETANKHCIKQRTDRQMVISSKWTYKN